MADASIPVDLFNPGQVFACLGFLEATGTLLGGAEGCFDWRHEDDVRFHLSASGEDNPVATVLEFLAETEIRCVAPSGYADSPLQERDHGARDAAGEEDDTDPGAHLVLSDSFPARQGDRMALPIRMGGGTHPVIDLGHWADGSGRDTFKLYSGNRSAEGIARAMLHGTRRKPTKRQMQQGLPGAVKNMGVTQLWDDSREQLIASPFHVLTPMGGSFNFDPRGAWTAIDAGYSLNQHDHTVEASPVVEFLAAWGLEHVRPLMGDYRLVRYAAWGTPLPLALARAALIDTIPGLPIRRFHFTLAMSGKNKVVTFAEEEPTS